MKMRKTISPHWGGKENVKMEKLFEVLNANAIPLHRLTLGC